MLKSESCRMVCINLTIPEVYFDQQGRATVSISPEGSDSAATITFNGKYIKGKKISLKFKAKTYKAKTNKKGVATFTIKKNVLKKLKKGKKYSYRVTYIKDTVKKTIKVKK